MSKRPRLATVSATILQQHKTTVVEPTAVETQSLLGLITCRLANSQQYVGHGWGLNPSPLNVNIQLPSTVFVRQHQPPCLACEFLNAVEQAAGYWP